MGNVCTCGPNEAMIVSGGCSGSDQKITIVGGWAWAWWCVTDVQRQIETHFHKISIVQNCLLYRVRNKFSDTLDMPFMD